MAQRSFDLEQLDKRRQENLINFLNADLDLGFTFIETAKRRSPDHADYAQALEKARKVVQAVRQFEGSIADQEIWRTIHHRADELNKLIATL